MKLRELQKVVSGVAVYNDTGSKYLFEIWSSENSYPDEITKYFDSEVLFVYNHYESLRCNIKELE